MKYLLLTILVAITGGLIGIYFKIPAGAMVGSMVAVVLFNLLWGHAYFPQDLRKIVQIAAGALIGSRMSRKDILELKGLLKPGIMLVFGLLTINFVFGFVIHLTSPVDMATALLATAPGGLSDMALIASDMGADVSVVTVLQLLRLVSVISLFPFLTKFFCKHFDNNKGCNLQEVEKCPKTNGESLD